eukprot:5843854-Pyramimonas_sp.AAC.1
MHKLALVQRVLVRPGAAANVWALLRLSRPGLSIHQARVRRSHSDALPPSQEALVEFLVFFWSSWSRGVWAPLGSLGAILEPSCGHRETLSGQLNQEGEKATFVDILSVLRGFLPGRLHGHSEPSGEIF